MKIYLGSDWIEYDILYASLWTTDWHIEQDQYEFSSFTDRNKDKITRLGKYIYDHNYDHMSSAMDIFFKKL